MTTLFRAPRAAIVGTLAVGAVLLVTGCDKPSGAPAAGTATPAATASATADPGTAVLSTSPPTEPAAAVLADGKHPVFITSVNVTGKKITFDLVQFLTGTAADDAWKIDYPTETDGAPNGYYIVNKNPKLRTLPLAGSAVVTVVDLSGSSPKNVPVPLSKLPGHIGSSDAHPPFWITVSGGAITKVDEQFVP